jgi:hypothetical protein
MINEPLLKDALVSGAEAHRDLNAVVSILIDEIAALRETVRALDPAFDEVLARKREENSSDAIRKASARKHNEIVRRLKDELIL